MSERATNRLFLGKMSPHVNNLFGGNGFLQKSIEAYNDALWINLLSTQLTRSGLKI